MSIFMYTGHYNILSMYVCMYVCKCARVNVYTISYHVYTFTKLHDRRIPTMYPNPDC